MKQQLDYLIEHRGLPAAHEYAQQTLRVYETCMLKKDHFCNIQPFRPYFVSAVTELKLFLSHD